MPPIARPKQEVGVPIPVAAERTTGAGGHAPVISIRDLKIHCATCSMRELPCPADSTPPRWARSTR